MGIVMSLLDRIAIFILSYMLPILECREISLILLPSVSLCFKVFIALVFPFLGKCLLPLSILSYGKWPCFPDLFLGRLLCYLFVYRKATTYCWLCILLLS